ncbi:transglycosylase domain-containing protein [Dyadobacter fanqingshengii]|uniref:Transglycosylase domain-containing protein n=1 Tax=Dyadobacter fanqingshengii TaxID=2906443 RepID=A0A9X1PD08_9BACT|nr:transglycosylase domain-containing protein [Dyadobacter fanqingshengii]MCF0041453.1 transglycosylase domain-containing protein [Dyadobacter fanqingshengii]USJ36828.1 transglycosylase domain-containing protein [Dyadobacter fanqingshengii]
MIELQPGKYRHTIVRLWKISGACIVLFVFFIVAVRVNLLWLFGGMPDLVMLENPQSELASELISEDGKLLGKYYSENRIRIGFDQLSPVLVNALIATEDARFSDHSGIDGRSMLRVVKGIFTGNSSSGGGSTITQQVAKNLFETRSRKYRGILQKVPVVGTVVMKTKEWILAVILERKYTKREIMMMYLNTVSFGNNTYGIKVASKSYFGKDPLELTVSEAALLVGMLQNPSLHNPLRRPANATRRRNVVMAQMVRYNYLTAGEFNELKDKPLNLRFKLDGPNAGLAPYFQESMRGYLQAWLKLYNEENDTDLDLKTSGLRIYTTIDSRLQQQMEVALNDHMREQQRLFDAHWKGRNPWAYPDGREVPGFIEKAVKSLPQFIALKKDVGEAEAWKAMRKPYKMKVFSYDGEKEMLLSPMDSIRYYKRFLHAGMMSMDPRNGHVKAWVGGVNFKYFKYDHVKQGRRQPGSTFKPFVYVSALQKNFLTPCDRITDQPVEGNWNPPSSQYTYQSLTLRQALGQSVNSISANIIQMVKPATVADYAHKLGITSQLDEVPSLCLGISSVSVYEMVNAYCSFANGGYRTEPLSILRIEDRNGHVLQQFHQKQNQELSDVMAYNMLYLMRGAVEDPGGTAGRLRSYGVTEGNQIAAKTGTTQNHSDAWFMGMTQNLVSGIWVGGEDMQIHFRTMALGQGGHAALPAWGLYMKKVYADHTLEHYKKAPFNKPANFTLTCQETATDTTGNYIPPALSDDEGVSF